MQIDVLHLLPSLSLFGGTPRKVCDLINCSPRTHAVYCWAKIEPSESTALSEKRFRDSNITIFKGGFGLNIYKHVVEIRKIIKEHDIKIVHGYFETGLIIAGSVKYISRKIATTVSFVGFPSETSKYRRLLIPFFLRKIDHIIYVSNFTRKEYETEYSSFCKLPSSVIYNGVKKRDSEIKIEKRKNTTKLITTSGLVKWKNVNILLEAVSLLKKENQSDIELIIIGDGPERLALEKRVKELNIFNQVRILGYISDVGSQLSISDIYVHPALKEGFGLAVVEAMLANLPVIVSNAGALPELVQDGRTGIIVDALSAQSWKDAIIHLRNNPDLSRQLGINGCKYAQFNFNVDIFAKRHEMVYIKILNAIQ